MSKSLSNRLTALERAHEPNDKPLLMLGCDGVEPIAWRGGADFEIHRRKDELLEDFNQRASREARARGIPLLIQHEVPRVSA